VNKTREVTVTSHRAYQLIHLNLGTKKRQTKVFITCLLVTTQPAKCNHAQDGDYTMSRKCNIIVQKKHRRVLQRNLLTDYDQQLVDRFHLLKGEKQMIHSLSVVLQW
jgi:hypothetical protein